jgi:DNA-binding protein WhiA
MRIQEVGTRQQELLLALETRIGLNHLDDNMYALAQVRLEHPDASLSELSDHYFVKTHQRLTKSGINHRMQKLIALAKRLTNEEGFYG